MHKKDKDKPVPAKNEQLQSTKPREKYGFHFSSGIKISDPNTGKVILQMRCN